MVPFLVGLDLGKLGDYTAMAIATWRLERWGNVAELHYAVRHIERFPLNTPYAGQCLHGKRIKFPCRECPKQVSIGGVLEQVMHRLTHLPVPEAWQRQTASLGKNLYQFPAPPRPYHLILDATGVGQAVADIFKAVEYWPIMVTITHGYAVTEVDRDQWHIAKRQLVSPLQVVLQTRRMQVIDTTLGRLVQKEAASFDYRMETDGKSGDEQYAAWRENEHDDVLLAVALLTWYGEMQKPMQPVEQQQTHAVSDFDPRVKGVA